MPFIKIIERDTDFFESYVKGRTRLDRVSSDYYGSPDFGWLILQANPQYGSMEFNIPDGANIRIPFPLDSALIDYKKGIDNYNKLYD